VFCATVKEHALAVYANAIQCLQETIAHVLLKPIRVCTTAHFQALVLSVLVMVIVNVADATAHL